jgi:hypothetical protein
MKLVIIISFQTSIKYERLIFEFIKNIKMSIEKINEWTLRKIKYYNFTILQDAPD